MVFLLELASISVCSACISAFLCMVTNGTCQLPPLVSFRHGLLKPQFVYPFTWPNRNQKICKILSKQEKQICRGKSCCADRKDHSAPGYDPKDDPVDQFVVETCGKEKTKVYRKRSWPHYKKKPYKPEPTPSTEPTPLENFKEYWACKDDDANPRACGCSCCEDVIGKTVEQRKTLKHCKFCGKSSLLQSLVRPNTEPPPPDQEKKSCAECVKEKRSKERQFRVAQAFTTGRKLDYDLVTSPVKSSNDDFVVLPVGSLLHLNRRYCYLEALKKKINKRK